MAFYTPRNISQSDQLLFDANGNAVGIQAAGSSSQPVLGMTPAKAAAVDSLVSADGNLAEAAVASTTGTPGEVRKLSDGPNKGIVLTWAKPEGRDTYAWCWQIYPLAAYL